MVDITRVEMDSAERVALELTHTISNQEIDGPTQDRAYWLTLYSQCLRVAHRGDPQKFLMP